MMDREKILEVVQNARFSALLDAPQGRGTAKEPNCEDEVCFGLCAHREIITQIGYSVTEASCMPLKAAAEAAARLAFEKPVMEAYLINAEQIGDAVGGLDAASIHCAMMVELALKRAIVDYVNKRNAAN